MNTGPLRSAVATALTVHGIETLIYLFTCGKGYLNVATALTVHGIETVSMAKASQPVNLLVATALTVHGIETCSKPPQCFSQRRCCNSPYRLQY